jgi:hypothetical protein
VGKGFWKESVKLYFQKPYSIVSIFYLLESLGLRALFFFIYWVKTINFIEDLANYPYPPFSLLLSSPSIQASGKP